MFEKRGVNIISMFDVDPNLIGRSVGGVMIRDMAELKQFCAEIPIDMAVLTLPKERAKDVSNLLVDYGICGFWNFTGVELSPENPSVVVENVHLGDSLMILNYKLCKRADDKK